MCDGSKVGDISNTAEEPEGRMQRFRRRMREWQIRQQVARGLAYGAGSGAVSLIMLWVQTR
ncbi:hypothetical protein [Streptomyces pseudogriseolus]|uniref:hypothetical protein n=1 Tax=Streptomyces pseudogriseolus TaxID=36817 RepID=UPI003FA2FE3F